jgi:hypothetical protein
MAVVNELDVSLVDAVLEAGRIDVRLILYWNFQATHDDANVFVAIVRAQGGRPLSRPVCVV